MRKAKKKDAAPASQTTMRMTKTRIAFILFCCLIPVVEWLIFYIYGNGSSFLMAFTNGKGEFGFDNFIRLWEEVSSPNGVIRESLINTLKCFVIVLVMFPFQVLVSYFIYKKVPGYSIWRILFFMPVILFSVAQSLIISRMLSVSGFVAEGVQAIFGMKEVPELLADSRYANITLLALMVWFQIPGDLVIWGGTFSRIPEEVLESGRIDGVNWWQEFTQIIVPVVWPTVGLKMVLMVCGIFNANTMNFLLTNGEYGTQTLATWMYKELLNGASTGISTAYNYMSAVGLVMTVIAVSISLFIRSWVDKAFQEVEF